MQTLTKKIAVVGATGAVGRVFLDLLDEFFPGEKELYLLASERSQGVELACGSQVFRVSDLSKFDFSEVDLAFFSAGASIAENFAPKAVEQGCSVIDNSSRFRKDKNVPLVIPEVNGSVLDEVSVPMIISNPNCSTAQLLVALKPVHDLFKIKRVDAVTFQAVSGSGQIAIDELLSQTEKLLHGENISPSVYDSQIAFNVISAGNLEDNFYTDEEMKISNETKKILDDSINITATAVRVPVVYGHSIAAHIETYEDIDQIALEDKLSSQDGLIRHDSKDFLSPNPIEHAAGKNPVSVGRVRADLWEKNRVNMWIVADNLRKGAALNSIQILKKLLDK